MSIRWYWEITEETDLSELTLEQLEAFERHFVQSEAAGMTRHHDKNIPYRDATAGGSHAWYPASKVRFHSNLVTNDQAREHMHKNRHIGNKAYFHVWDEIQRRRNEGQSNV
jgi:hypothetical protein